MAPAFVILRHTGHGPAHVDFMLQDGQALATWQLAMSPVQIGQGQAIPATKLPDHRLHYLSYEGPVSGDRGRVKRLDQGTFAILERREDCWRIRLEGTQLRGEFELARQVEGVWQLRRL